MADTYRRNRSTAPLPYLLTESVVTHMDEALFSQAIQILSTNLESGNSLENPTPALVPSSHILSIIATLAVHPNYTSHAKSYTIRETSDAAIMYLDAFIKTVDPISFDLATAWPFQGSNAAPRRRENRRQLYKRAQEEHGQSNRDANDSDSNSSGANQSNAREPRVTRSIAKKQNLFTRTDSFWTLFGWGMTCSAIYTHRWTYYKLLLRLMIDSLEEDWRVRLEKAQTQPESAAQIMKESVVVRWLGESNSSRTAKRQLLRDILSGLMPMTHSMQNAEIFKDEIRPLEKKKPETSLSADIPKRKVLNLEAGEFGDYYDSMSSEDDTEAPGGADSDAKSNPRRKSARSRQVKEENPQSPLPNEPSDSIGPTPAESSKGFFEALVLRKRLLVLLSSVAKHFPAGLTTLEDLIDVYAETLRNLPLRTMMFLVGNAPGAPAYAPPVQAAIARMLLRVFVPGARIPYAETIPTQLELETLFLPHAAPGIGTVESAKVAGLAEGLMRLCWDDLKATPSLKEAVEKGIHAREEKSGGLRLNKSEEKQREDADAGAWMRASHRRMEMVLGVLPLGSSTDEVPDASA